MSTDRDVTTRIVRSWLHEDVHEDADRILNLVLDEIDTTPQRSASWLARRFSLMNNYARFAFGAAAVVVAALLAINLLPRIGVGGEPTATPEPSAVPFSSTPINGTLDPGSIVMDGDFPLAIVFDVPAGWSREGTAETADLVSVHKIRGDSTPAWSSWTTIATVYADPCHALSRGTDPPIGPTVDDLVTALTSMVGFVSTSPTDVTVGGYAGKRFQLSTTVNPGTAGCDDDVWLFLWEPTSGGERAGVPGAVTMQFWVLDVDGTRLVMFTEEYDPATSADIAESIEILESVRFR